MSTSRPLGNRGTDQAITGEMIRQVTLEVVDKCNTQGPGYFQTGTMLREIAETCRVTSTEDQQAILTVWHDLFRAGLLAPGYNIDNPSFPHCHVTEQGRERLRHLSHDPANPEGYLHYVGSKATLDDVSRSYLEEAVKTFNSSCYKAAAVMVGGATEALLLQLRDKIVTHLTSAGTSIPAGMNDWRVKTIRDAITSYLDGRRDSMPRTLRDSYNAYWTAFAEQIRQVRNEAGHPTSVDPVTDDSVHGSLLIFPELAKLIGELESWIVSVGRNGP